MAVSELNHEKRSGVVRVIKPDGSIKTYKHGYLDFGVESGFVEGTLYQKWTEYCTWECGKRSTTSPLPGHDSADPCKPVHTRDIVTDTWVSSSISIMTLTLWTALHTQQGFTPRTPFSKIAKPPWSLIPLHPYVLQ
jgi:hypothetical protein